jgi:hypothetical protein
VELAQELLKVGYFSEEFGFANNSLKHRGYNIISSPEEIVGLDEGTKLKVQAPTVSKNGLEIITEVWFWGAHNCQLHTFTLTMNGEAITGFKDDILGEYGHCERLIYE